MAKWKEIDTPTPEAIVRAALERAAWEAADCWEYGFPPSQYAARILALAADPEAVAEIINTATQFTAATKENKQ